MVPMPHELPYGGDGLRDLEAPDQEDALGYEHRIGSAQEGGDGSGVTPGNPMHALTEHRAERFAAPPGQLEQDR